jgi:hypothetical protein
MKEEKRGKVDKFRWRDLSAGEFFRISFSKVIINIIVSLALALFFLLYLPFARNLFLSESFTRQIVDIVFNTIIYMIVLYPYTCLLRYLIWRKK